MTVDERRTSRVQFKDEIQVDKTEEVQTEDDKTTERDLEAEFAGIFEGPEGGGGVPILISQSKFSPDLTVPVHKSYCPSDCLPQI